MIMIWPEYIFFNGHTHCIPQVIHCIQQGIIFYPAGRTTIQRTYRKIQVSVVVSFASMLFASITICKRHGLENFDHRITFYMYIYMNIAFFMSA